MNGFSKQKRNKMKTTYRFFLWGFCALLAFSCKPEEKGGFDSDSRAVVLQTRIASPGTVVMTRPHLDQEQSVFSPQDVVMVSNGMSFVGYRTEDGNNWSPVSDQYLRWEQNSMDFQAYYPQSASMDAFELPSEQDGTEGSDSYIGRSDYMTFSGTVEKGAENTASISFQRQTARVVIDIADFGGQFGETPPTVTSLKVVSPAASLPKGTSSLEVTPYGNGTRYVALLLPGETSGKEFIRLKTSASPQQTLTVMGQTRLEAGYSYLFTLKVGKETVLLDMVSVEAWKDGVLTPVNNGETSDKGIWTDQDGTVHVNNASGLLQWASRADVLVSRVVLEDNIDMSGKEWNPLGTLTDDPSTAYTGVFDGNGYEISHLQVSTEDPYAGMFGVTGDGSHIHDLNLHLADVSTSHSNGFSGGIAGLNGGKIEDCRVSGSVSGLHAGGIAGNNSVQVNRCTVAAITVTATGNNCQAGGIAAQNYGTVNDCRLEENSSITATPQNSFPSAAGGIVGTNTNGKVGTTSGRVLSCHTTGSSISAVKAGGIVGENEYGTLAQCVSENMGISHPASSLSSYLGGVLGVNTHGDVVACHTQTGIVGEEGLTSLSMGGLCGADNGHTTNQTHIYGCYVFGIRILGSLSGGSESGKGALVGYSNANSVIRSCYAVPAPDMTGLALVGASASGATKEYCVEVGSTDYAPLTQNEVPDLTTLNGYLWQADHIWVTEAGEAPTIDADYMGTPPTGK